MNGHAACLSFKDLLSIGIEFIV